jgi:hypothetical protein
MQFTRSPQEHALRQLILNLLALNETSTPYILTLPAGSESGYSFGLRQFDLGVVSGFSNHHAATR